MNKLFILIIIPFLIFSQQTTYVPDNNFEQALIDLGYDNIIDNYVLTNNINTIISLDIGYLSIYDLIGIEDFTALEILLFNNNELTQVDLSQNINLKELKCYNNQLTELDVSQNTLLEHLGCAGNQLTELNTLQNTLLKIFQQKSLKYSRN